MFTAFHSTNNERAERILQNQEMEFSLGDRHWLGDGSYFFEEVLYAYNWIKIMYCDYFNALPELPEILLTEYSILQAEICCDSKRIFDLDKAEYKILYDRALEKCCAQMDTVERLKKYKMSEGVIINILFNELNYSEEFDIVIATFIRRQEKYKILREKGFKGRLFHLPEKQICVKNLSCTAAIVMYNISDELTKLEELISQINKVITIPKENGYKYQYKPKTKYKL